MPPRLTYVNVTRKVRNGTSGGLPAIGRRVVEALGADIDQEVVPATSSNGVAVRRLRNEAVRVHEGDEGPLVLVVIPIVVGACNRCVSVGWIEWIEWIERATTVASYPGYQPSDP